VRTIFAAAILAFIFAAICSPLGAQTTRPIFLFSMEGKGVPTGTIHVYSVNSSTGAITEVPGSPFNAGLIPEQLVVDSTGRFVYVTNEQSQDITGFSVDPSTGALTELPGAPYSIGTPPNTSAPVVSAVDPTGRFFYVFATSVVNDVLEEFLYEYTIDSVTGVLTAASSSPTPWVSGQGILAVSIAFDPEGNYAYVGQVAANAGAPTVICSIDFTSGTLTPIGSVQPATTGEASQIAVSPSGSLLYSINTPASEADAFTVGSQGGSLTEISASPYFVPQFPSSLVVHPSGNFLYVANENESYQANLAPSQFDGSISAFAIDSGTGGLTPVPGSPFPDGINPTSIVLAPTGNFAYSTSTIYTSATTSSAQIQGFSIDAASGILTPLSWSPWTDSAESVAGGLAISYGPSTPLNPVPMISSLSPPSTTASDTAFTLQVIGSNFVPGATVYFGGQARVTMFVSSTQLNANILASDIDNDGTAVVFVFNPLPGGGASTSVEFPVSALSPIISSISPSNIPASGNPFNLTVSGSNFVTSSFVNFNGAPLATSFQSPEQITAEIAATDAAVQGAVTITVTTPSNGVTGGGTSNAVILTIGPVETQPVVSSISPTSATGGGAAFTLTVNGSGFVQGSQVSFNMNNVPTTLVSSTQLTASIPASAIAMVGYPQVIVTNPGGLVSLPLLFTIINPQPGGGSVTPPSLPAGSNALTLDVIGTGFTQSSVVLISGNSRVTTYENSTLLLATLLPSDLAQGGTLNITVMNPPPGGGTSAVISFTVTDYKVTPPSSPTSVTAGQTAHFVLTVSSSTGTFSNPVTFSVSTLTTLPAGASASFNPSSPVTPGTTPQTVTLSIATTARTSASLTYFPSGSNPVLALLCLVGLVFALAGLGLGASGCRVQRPAAQLLLALLLLAALGLAACGGGGAPSSLQPNPPTGTPAGTYTIQVIATSGGASHSTTVTLTVM
jgi:6-phosphogluconolactonase (cycloisomerase 2 family)